MYLLSGLLVPEAGLEPAWYCYRRILSPLRLPVSPLGHATLLYINRRTIAIKNVSTHLGA